MDRRSKWTFLFKPSKWHLRIENYFLQSKNESLQDHLINGTIIGGLENKNDTGLTLCPLFGLMSLCALARVSPSIGWGISSTLYSKFLSSVLLLVIWHILKFWKMIFEMAHWLYFVCMCQSYGQWLTYFLINPKSMSLGPSRDRRHQQTILTTFHFSSFNYF